MTITEPRVAVAVISYRRPDQLARLLESLQAQFPRKARWQCRIVVVDNDADSSARATVQSCRGPWPVHYAVEPRPGIPFARERSVQECPDDDAVVFIDDDEMATPAWLDTLVAAWLGGGADVVTGPVRGILPPDAPQWARHSDAYDSVGKHPDGAPLPHAYTNNTLVSRRVLDTVTPAFDATFAFTGSSDLNFFQRVHAAGFRITWCAGAIVEEDVPEARLTLGWLARRAFRSGAGDAISRRLVKPGLRGAAEGAVMGVGRIANGMVLIVLGARDPARRIKGARRLVSGIGTLAGLGGVNYEEYRRQPS